MTVARWSGWWSCVALVLAACSPGAPWSEPPSVAIDLLCESSVETVPLLGEFELQIDLYHREDLAVEFEPEIPDGCSGQIEWLPDQSLGQGLWRRAVMRLRALEGPGELVIAPFKAVAEDGTISATTP